jgi:hypothetical protein
MSSVLGASTALALNITVRDNGLLSLGCDPMDQSGTPVPHWKVTLTHQARAPIDRVLLTISQALADRQVSPASRHSSTHSASTNQQAKINCGHHTLAF